MKNRILHIATYSYSRALILQARFESENIECFTLNENMIQPDVSAGVQIMIREADVEHAMKIIEDVKQEYGEDLKLLAKKEGKIKKILVPVDFSEQSTVGFRFAIGLARVLQAKIRLLHTYLQPSFAASPYEDHTFPMLADTYSLVTDTGKEMQKALEKYKRIVVNQVKTKSEYMPEISKSIAEGIPAEAIMMYSQKYKPDIIIMGMRGKGDKKSVVGGTTAELIEKSSIPVLAIPHDYQFEGVNKNLNVLYATDFDDTDFLALSELLQFIEPFNAKVHCVHVSLGIKKPWDKAKFNEMQQFLQDKFGGMQVECEMIVGDNVFNSLETYIRNNNIGLLAMTTHKRNIIQRLLNPSMTKRMLYHTRLPLLVFPF
ncbi:MAG: universal stress protein [Lentimicrobiaceae bacterium]|nr:universal stress protein [Lentimicrobiaceae bacterium]